MFACEPGRGIDDGVGPVDELELLVAPVGALGTLVRAVAHLGRILLQRLGRIGGVEDELRHLPVALVGVVEVVEGIEEPVLERELAGIAGVLGHVGVHRRRGCLRQATSPELVVAAGIERVARKVEVVVVAVLEICGLRPDLDEVGAIPGAAKRHGRLVEQHVDVGRDVRLARTTLLRLVDEADDRCVTCREILLRPGKRCAGEGQRAGEADRSNGRTYGPGHPHEANVFDGTSRCPPGRGSVTMSDGTIGTAGAVGAMHTHPVGVPRPRASPPGSATDSRTARVESRPWKTTAPQTS